MKSPESPFEIDRSEFRDLLDQFSDRWRHGTRPRLNDYLGSLQSESPQLQRKILLELIKIDLECRWQKSSTAEMGTQTPANDLTSNQSSIRTIRPVLLEQYLDKWPELGSADDLPLDTILHEYRARCQWGDRPDHRSYLERFSRHADLAAGLTAIDRELGHQESSMDAETGGEFDRTLLPGADAALDRTLIQPSSIEQSSIEQSSEHPPSSGSTSPVESGSEPSGMSRMSVPASESTVPVLGGKRFGNYELQDEIARGAMGVVYKARQLNPNRTVAIKMILSGQLANDEEVRRFYIEANAAGNLKHPNIVTIFDSGENAGQHYISMDFIEGCSLADAIRENPLDQRRAAQYLKTIAEAIHYAHTQHVLHRDLKPSNILLDKQNQPHVTDFGIAKRVEEDCERTDPGSVLGTPSYMPPEQAQGETSRIGPKSDVYSLGAILYQLLTGRPPFLAKTVLDTLMQVVHNDPVSPRVLNPEVDRDLETVCLKCLQKDPRQRYATAKELAEELERFLRHEPIVARPISTTARLLKWCRRNPALASLTAVTVGLLIFIPILTTLGYLEQKILSEEAVDARNAAEASREDAQLNMEKAKAAESEAMAEKKRAEEARNDALAAQKRSEEAKEQERVAKNDAIQKQKEAEKAKEQERLSRLDAQKQSRRASENLALAKQVVDEMLKRLADERLRNIPQVDSVREEMLAQAGEFYQAMLKGNETDAPELQAELADNNSRMGRIQQLLHHNDEAHASFEAAIAIFKTLVSTDPANRSRHELSIMLNERNLGDLTTDLHRPDEARVHYDTALEIGTRLTNEVADATDATDNSEKQSNNPPSKTELQYELARTYNSLFLLYDKPDSRGDARRALQFSLDLHRELVAESPDNPDFRQKLALAYSNMGKLEADAGRPDDAIRYYTSAIELQRSLLDEKPEERSYQEDLARSLNNRGYAAYQLKRPADAVKDTLEAITTLKKLANHHPEALDYQFLLAAAHITHGLEEIDLQQTDSSIATLTQAIELLQTLIAQLPDGQLPDARYREALAKARRNRAVALTRRQPPDFPAAEHEANLALELVRTLVVEFPHRLDYRNDLAETLFETANYYELQKQPQQAVPLYDDAIEQIMLAGKDQVSPLNTDLLLAVRMQLGLNHAQGKPPRLVEAEKQWQANVSLLTELVDKVPQREGYRVQLADTLRMLGALYNNQQQTKTAIIFADRAVKVAEQLHDQHPDNKQYTQLLTECRAFRDSLN